MKESVAKLATPQRARLPLAARIRIANEAVGRIAAFPIEMLDEFASPKLANLVSHLRQAEQEINERKTELLAELFHAVSNPVDKPTRTWLLEVKRTAYNGLTPWRPPTSLVRQTIDSVMATRLDNENQARCRVVELRERLDATYGSELHRQCSALRSATRSSQFTKALTLANPPLSARWQPLSDDAPRNKHTRNLEHAVCHYLLRAVGRTTPSDAWAGVARIALTDSENDLVCSSGTARYVAAPDLLPFRQVVEQLVQSPRYRETYPLRMDAAAHLEGERWWGIGADGEWIAVPRDSFVDGVTESFGGGIERSASDLIDALANSMANPEEMRPRFAEAIGRLLDAGVLSSSLQFPGAPPSAWKALELVTDQLLEPERSAWSTAVERCRVACTKLADGYESLKLKEIARFQEDVRLAIAELAEQVGVEVDLPAQIIKLDRTVPFAINWSSRLMDRMRDSVVSVLEFHAQAGAAEVFRKELLASLLGATRALAELVRTQPDLDGCATRAALARFKAWIIGEHEPAIDEALPGPYGTLMFILAGEPVSPYFTWGRSTPDFASCRAYELLDRTEHDLPFVASLHPQNFQPLEIAGIDAANPNATIRLPARKSREVGRHKGTIANFSRIEVEVDADGRPWLRMIGESERFVPTYSAPAGIGVTDPAARFLVRLSMAHGWEFISFGVPLAAIAADVEGHKPVPVNKSSGVLGLQQWVLPANFVRELRQRKGADQYCAWRRAIDDAGIGEWVWVGPAARPDAPRLLLRADSPFLLLTVLESFSEDCGSLAITSVPDPAHWPVKDAEGNHYLCEIAVTWADSEHWNEVCH